MRDGSINLDDSLERLGIDDDPRLTQNEKQATLRMLLQSRSGVYHSYVGGTPDMREKMPPREAHPPGTFWYYNNWDFNVLGAVYERKLNKKIGDAFQTEIAAPIHMEDFRTSDIYYLKAPENAEAFARSDYPAYHFRLSARDMARLGYLFLRRGNWNGPQIIPVRLGDAKHKVILGDHRFWRGLRLWLSLVGAWVWSRDGHIQRTGRFRKIHRGDSRAGFGCRVRQSHGISRRPPSRIGRRGEKASRCSHSRDEQAFGPVTFGSTVEGDRAGVVRSVSASSNTSRLNC